MRNLIQNQSSSRTLSASAMAITRKGDLLDFPYNIDLIVQQSNCLTTKSHGLSHIISKKLNIDPYATRIPIRKGVNLATPETRGIIGTNNIENFVFDDNENKNYYVASLMAQIAPGKPNIYYRDITNGQDTSVKREQYFKECLNDLVQFILLHPDIKTIGFPYKIGCGLAGGKWEHYKNMINEFAQSLPPDYKVYIIDNN